MRVVEWEDRYCLGIDVIDGHHQHLVELLNKSYNAIFFERDMDEISSIFRELSEYTDYHFKSEEEMMARVGYSRINSHISEHETFKKNLKELQSSLLASEMVHDNEIIFFLEGWLLNHILVSDKDYVEFVKSKR